MPRKTPPDADLRNRIQRVLDEQFGGNKTAMARAIGAGSSGSTITNWLSRNKSMDPTYAFRLQDKYQWNARWLLEGVGPARLTVLDPADEALLESIRNLPPERRRALAAILGL